MSRYKAISFFDGLNSLRFFAAFLVVMHHSETIRKKNDLFNLEWLGLFRNGGNAVTFFFVLSGFLITYLLLKEKNKTGTVSIKKFYLKRTLRIWPLYFLLVFLGTIVLPVAFGLLHVEYEMPYTLGQTWPYFLFFLPGLVTFYFGHHLLEPLWSIGVEEVFYLIWAPLFKYFKENILSILVAIIILKIIAMILAQYFIKAELFGYIVNIFSFEAMAIGGLGAYFVFHRQSPLASAVVFKKGMQVLVYFILSIFLIFHTNIDNVLWDAIFNTPVFSKLIIDLLFLYLIIGVSLVETSLIKSNNKFLSYLGEISYGIYMYHMIVILSIIQLLKKQLMELSPGWSMVVFYAILFPSVIIVSSLSKKLFENYFLNLKAKLDKTTSTR